MKLFSFVFFSILILNLITGCKSATDRKPVTVQQPPPPVNNQTISPSQNQSQIIEKSGLSPEVSKKIISVIKENLDATEKKDKQRVLNTIHKDSPQRQATINGINFIFKKYNFHFNIDDIKVRQVIGDSAVVYFKETTTPVGNQQGISPNTAVGFYYMKKQGDDWKIFSTKFLNTDYK